MGEVEPSLRVYAPECYDALRHFFDAVAQSNSDHGLIDALHSSPFAPYLESIDLRHRLGEVARNVASGEAFRKRALRWFDGFHALKAIHWLCAERYPKVPIDDAARVLLARLGQCAAGDSHELLSRFRGFERAGWLSPAPHLAGRGVNRAALVDTDRPDHKT